MPRDVVIAAGIGSRMYPLDGADAMTLLARADAALNAGKAGGKEGLVFAAVAVNPAASA